MQLAGIDSQSSSDIDGKSFAGVLRGEQDDRGPVFWHYPHYGNQGGRPGGAVRDGQWKLIEWYTANGRGELELYNLEEDLGESNNLADSLPKKRDELHALLSDWRKSLDAKMPTPRRPVQPVTASAAPIKDDVE